MGFKIENMQIKTGNLSINIICLCNSRLSAVIIKWRLNTQYYLFIWLLLLGFEDKI